MLWIGCLIAVLLALGQLMMKLAAGQVKERIAVSFIDGVLSPWLLSALMVYFGASLLWVWVLTQMPLNRAYPFVLAGAALVPALASVFLGEAITWSYILGLGLVLCGVAIIQFRY